MDASKIRLCSDLYKKASGGAAQFYELALKKNKKVINLPDIMSDD